ncbi:hypothetical protein DEU42_103122 [Flavobacterium sp. AG291]|nr:hypothetical protein DEU42_103122 [Flavobacterium sp. AG291]
MKDNVGKLIPIICVGLLLLYLGSLYIKATNNAEIPLQEQQMQTSSSESYDSTSQSYEKSKTCSWCSTQFTGVHYTHLGRMSDCTSTYDDNSIGKYCSLKCCNDSRKKSCPTCP